MLHSNTLLQPNNSTYYTLNEINNVIVEDEIVASLELLKVLHKCQHKQGWTLLVAPDNVPNKSLLESASVDASKLLVIRQKHIYDLEYVLKSAISNGNFAAVVIWTDIASVQTINKMELPVSDVAIHCFQSA
ncbi:MULTISPECIES: SulA-like leucine-rich domain-containing protein [Pseudoalteromonas]|uniref:SulA-like leucine-rich domain-containing protein n=2 Tax=Pseudoalteromonas TaxID=53246 RepID=A0A8I2GZT8_9GAMM|nr:MULTISPECIES: SulA-like leucine-rich domain-containing protein [Pseudoalteromonas]ATD06033.1 hypothetical protein PPIS_a0802 [Pseudoalteromonas piscicida]KID37973.1 hypothetical protein QT15_04165 [Pseudoalteromonas flavipulchra NCIMB 2033 = ATCC BAA-314]MBD0782861.1 hypothetical protein [Pseudoalteromonas flavipulchra]MBE0372459.1 hypothetical protein [Pseudoalteromonas flavipulchra NCIMB 2033 = ATCC BAA-314]MCG9759953.1 hypothetical protein [Pseudoalteromonas sp. Isolate6]